jgi:hypothetical protein
VSCPANSIVRDSSNIFVKSKNLKSETRKKTKEIKKIMEGKWKARGKGAWKVEGKERGKEGEGRRGERRGEERERERGERKWEWKGWKYKKEKRDKSYWNEVIYHHQ